MQLDASDAFDAAREPAAIDALVQQAQAALGKAG